METRLWIGVTFGAALVVFFAIAYFRGKNISDGQLVILRFLSSLCAGCMGAAIAGEAIFSAAGKTGSGLDFAVSGTAGFALFFVVWFTTKQRIIPSDSFSFTPPTGSTFEASATAIAQANGAIVEFLGFSNGELAAILRSQQLSCADTLEALRHLGKLATIKFPEYLVTYQQPTYTLRTKK